MKTFKDKKNVVLAVLMVAVLIMSYGYGVLLQQLSVQGSAEIMGATWQVEITNITDKSILGSAKVLEKPSFTKTTATLKTGFQYKSDSVIYELTVENKGSLDAKLDSVNIVPGEGSKEAITYKVSNATPGATTLRAGETNKIDITVTYSNPENATALEFTENAQVVLDYIQSQS